MNEELMAKLYGKIGSNMYLLDNFFRHDTARYICYSEEEDNFLFAEYNSPAFNGVENYKVICTQEQYEDYIKQHNRDLSPNTVTEAFKLLETLAKQSNYDINITSVGTFICNEDGDEIRGKPEQLYKILEAQIHLRNLVKEVTSEPR